MHKQAEQDPVLISPEVNQKSLETVEGMTESMHSTSTSIISKNPIMDQTTELLKCLKPDISDISSEKILRNADSLISENRKLTRIIHQNNLALMNQCETLMQWQNEVERVCKSHKETSSDMNIHIEELQNEDPTLSSLIKDRPTSSASIKSFENVSSDEDKEKGEDDFQKAINILKQQWELNKEELENNKIKYDAQLKQIKENINGKLTSLEAVMENLKETHEKKCIEMYKENKDFQYNLAKLQDAAASFNLKIQNTKIEEENDQTEPSLLERIRNITCEKLITNQVNEEEMMNLMSRLSAAQAYIIDLKQQLQDKNTEIEKLNSQMKLQRTEADRIIAIEQQMILYKSNLDELRESKNIIIIEKNQIIDDFVNLQRRNQELLKELGKSEENSKVQEKKESIGTNWQCKTCTFHNIASKDICEMCGKNIEHNTIVYKLEAEGAQCKLCTFVNSKDDKVCAICSTDLYNTPCKSGMISVDQV